MRPQNGRCANCPNPMARCMILSRRFAWCVLSYRLEWEGTDGFDASACIGSLVTPPKSGRRSGPGRQNARSKLLEIYPLTVTVPMDEFFG